MNPIVQYYFTEMQKITKVINQSIKPKDMCFLFKEMNFLVWLIFS